MERLSVRKLALLALLEAPDGHGRPRQPIIGITRLQKLLFLTWKRLPRTSSDRHVSLDFAYQPQRYGPADLELYPDLDLLVALGHVKRGRSETLTEFIANRDSAGVEEATEHALSFSYLMGDESEAADWAAVEGVEEAFLITDKGSRLLEHVAQQVRRRDAPLCERVLSSARDVRAKYGDWPLSRLLRYVYSEFPEMTTASEIRDRVLGT